MVNRLKQSNNRHIIYALACIILSSIIWFTPLTDDINMLNNLTRAILTLGKMLLATIPFLLGVAHFINWFNRA